MDSINLGENWESEKNDNDNSFPANKVRRSFNRYFFISKFYKRLISSEVNCSFYVHRLVPTTLVVSQSVLIIWMFL
jgi:hypothetical protein